LSTVTPNFLWPVPQSTDLVKDGATAIEALGDSIDASLVDLKGGTSGQVLSKNSNTDMDFVWVAADDTNAIQNTIVDAKGDLIAASAADTPARLAVGNNGETLVADSSTSTGLRWQGSQAAGKNICINGGMDIWQRGTSSTAQGYVTADRWYLSGGTTTSTQETTTVPSGFQYSYKLAATGTTQPFLLQAIETKDAIQFAGKTVTLSYYVATSNSTNAYIRLDYSNSVDVAVGGAWTTISSDAAKATTTSFTRVQATYAVPSTAQSLRIFIGSGVNLTTGQSMFISGVQLELGSIATTFTKAGGTIQGELAACQRYYYRLNSPGSFTRLANGMAFSATASEFIVPFPIPMRIKPTALEQSGTAANYATYRASSNVDAATAVPTYLNSTISSGTVGLTSTNLVAGNATMLLDNNTAANVTFLAWSAEL